MDFLPDHRVTINFSDENFFIAIIIETTNQIHIITHCSKSGAFARRRLPQIINCSSNIEAEPLSFLMSLNKGL